MFINHYKKMNGYKISVLKQQMTSLNVKYRFAYARENPCMHADVILIRFQCKILRDLVKKKRSAAHRDRNASKHLVYGRFAVTILNRCILLAMQ